MNYDLDLENKTITVWNGYIPLAIKTKSNEELFKVENFVRNIKEDINLDYLLKLLNIEPETVPPEIIKRALKHNLNGIYLANGIFKSLLDNELYLAVGKLILYWLWTRQGTSKERTKNVKATEQG